ncbi:hypothetical protein JS562_43085, partial [Agrobacterium sp. S2]|nr:hypothetical protein [Agrobacterium sp. S2]
AFGRGFFVGKRRAIGNGLPLRPTIVLEENRLEKYRCFRGCRLPPSALPDISPTGGEIGKTRYRRFILGR